MADDAPEVASVSGADYERLHRDFVDATRQFAATNEILTALGRSAADPDAVLGAIVDRATALCRAQAAQIYLVQGDEFRLSRLSGAAPEEFVDYVTRHPIAVSRATLLGRVALDRRTQQIVDVLTDPGYGRQDVQRTAGYRTLMSAPMLVDDEVVGVLSVWRTAVDPFDERATGLLEVFAAQAAIAIRNMELVRALELRSAELATKVDQLEALSEVGEAVSSSLNLDEVLYTIVMNAVRLTNTDGGSIMEYVEADECFSVRSAFGSSQEMLDRLRSIRIERESTLVGRAALAGRPLEVPDLGEAVLDPHLQILYDAGWRSVVAVPMLRQEQMVGALVIRRKTTGSFAQDTLELLQTFASQSALAILNARLFGELETKTAELETASQHKSEFLASMSHELRTPLNAVIGFSEVLLDRMFGDINERQEEYLRDIWNSGRHLLDLLNEILDLSKVEAGQMEMERTTFAVQPALEYGLSLLRERCVAHAITLELQVASEVDLVEGDELRFKQVILNLVTNAVKFTPDGGTVKVAARVRDTELVVTVTDDGIGVPLEDRERIFESFQQGRRGAPKEEGTGLGLTLSRRIVELLDGRMWLQSQEGVGSTFGFALPLARSREPAEPSDDATQGDLPTVVLVDDDRASIDLLTAYLAGSPVDVLRAQDGTEGLELIRRHRPAAVVLDIRLPGLDGWEVLSRLKHDPITAAIPVVVVSIVDERPKGRALGAAEYLMKPLRREELLAALERVGTLESQDAPLTVTGRSHER